MTDDQFSNMTEDQFPSMFGLLFDGLREAYGSGSGRWVRDHVELAHYQDHLAGKGSGLGIAPLRRDGTVRFAAIDLDEPDFGFAREVAQLLPGTKFIERSRSGNAHVWAFFASPVPGWVPRGLMLHALEALGRNDVEVFPKQETLREGMLGNYINLPYHGKDAQGRWNRPMVEMCYGGHPERSEANLENDNGFLLSPFLRFAHRRLNDPTDWWRRAGALGIMPPEDRPATAEFGDRETPHGCAMYIYEHREDNPIRVGHRAVVLFSLSKMFANWRAVTNDRALELVKEVNAAGERPVGEAEVERIFNTVLRGQYTSCGCDDPLMADYIAPDCKIGHS